jgi:hypothetical protein
VARGGTYPDGVDFTLEWPELVTVAEIVYFGRTGGTENWKDFEVRVNGSSQAVVKGQLKPRDGPQRIKLPSPVQARKVTLKFLTYYSGNPGASEIQVYSIHPSDAVLGKFPPAPVGAGGK